FGPPRAAIPLANRPLKAARSAIFSFPRPSPRAAAGATQYLFTSSDPVAVTILPRGRWPTGHVRPFTILMFAASPPQPGGSARPRGGAAAAGGGHTDPAGRGGRVPQGRAGGARRVPTAAGDSDRPYRLCARAGAKANPGCVSFWVWWGRHSCLPGPARQAGMPAPPD